MKWPWGSRLADQGERFVVVWDTDQLLVVAQRGDGGALVIMGQDLNYPDLDGGDGVHEYEYSLTVRRRDIPKVLRALDAPTDADVLEVLEQRGADLVRLGEQRWLQRLGVEIEFWSRHG